MSDGKRPKDAAKHVNPAHPAQGVEVGKELTAAIALYRPVEALHDPVEMGFKPVSKKAGQGEDGELPALHAPANGAPAEVYIPRNADFNAAGITGRHTQIEEPVAEEGIEQLFHCRALTFRG